MNEDDLVSAIIEYYERDLAETPPEEALASDTEFFPERHYNHYGSRGV